MTAKEQVDYYLEYCKYRKELDEKTLKAYRIDLKQYFDAVSCDDPGKVEKRSAEKLWGRCPGIPVRLWKSRGTGKKAFRPG